MATEHANDGNAGTRRHTRRGVTTIRLGPPEVVPISEKDHRQAVTALATMIIDWWRSQEGRPPE